MGGDFFLHLIASKVARKIERGSALGAFVGTMLGIGIGIGVACCLVAAGLTHAEYSYTVFIILPLPLGLIGAVVGSDIGPRRAPVDSRLGIRLTRYNQVAGMIVATFMVLAFAVVLGVFSRKGNPSDEINKKLEVSSAVTFVVFAVVAFITAREICFVELGKVIFVRRLVGNRTYAPTELSEWGFDTRPYEVTKWGFKAWPDGMNQRTFTGTGICHLRFSDGKQYRIEVDGKDSQAIIDLLQGSK